MLPDGWKEERLAELLKNKTITVHIDGNHGNFYPKKEEFVSSGVPYISANCIQNGRIDFQKCKFLAPEKADKLQKGIAKDGDVLFAHNATVGPVALLKTNEERIILSTTLTLYRCDPIKLNNSFLYQYMSSTYFDTQYESIMRQTTRNQVPITAQREFVFLLPPLPEQKKIAAILSTWDRAIEGTEKLLANSQQQKKALMQQLLTGQKRLPGFTGEWKNTKLGNYISERKQRNKNSISQIVLSITNRYGFENPEEYFSKRVASSDISNYKIVKTGDFGYNPSRINVGSFARLKKHIIAVVSPIYVVFHTNEKILDGIYFDFWMRSHSAQQQILNSTQGSVRNSVNFDSLCQFKIKLPPLPEQKAIAAVLTAADEGITALQSDLANRLQEKKALMQQLLTGKRRVTVD